jgi:CDP-glycerol glycerophosphotransferase
MQNKIIKIYKQIRFVTKAILRSLFGFFIGLFIWRDKNIILIGNYTSPVFKINGKKEQFLHNTKYMYLYLNNSNTNMKFVYLCDEDDRTKKMHQCGLKNIYSRKSLRGIYYTLRAKYWITDYDKITVANPWLSHGAIVINFFHGYGPKKVVFLDDRYKPHYSPFIYKIWNACRLKEDYVVANSKSEANYLKSALLPKKGAKILGSPRLDVLINDIPNSDLFMEDDFNNIKSLKEQGYKLLIYMPTWRDTGGDVSGWLNNPKLNELLKQNKTVLICKLHPADKNFKEDKQSETLYFMKKNSDVYSILKYTDGLISDYSSIFVDYLLLDKPIIYYIYDIKEFQELNRGGFYRPFEEFVAGETPMNENQLLEAIQNVANGKDCFKGKRKELRDKYFIYQDGKNCERVINWIKELNNK